MGKLAEAYVDIGANLKPMQSGLGRAQSALTKFASKPISIGFGLGGAGGVAAIGAGMLAAAKKAADLGESISKVKVTFGRDAGAMIDQADDLAKRFGVVKQTTLDAASAFGLMGVAAKMSTGSAAKMGQEFVQLGLDLASFHNISNEEAFLKLRAGLAGEAEPLRPLGIMLSEDAVKAEALAMGLTSVKRELTEAEKIAARASLIKKQAGPAVGDLERTADSNANLMRKLEGELQNAVVDFGEGLQGALRDGIKLAHELGDTIRKATGKDVATNVGEMTQAAINVARVVNTEGGTGLIANAFIHDHLTPENERERQQLDNEGRVITEEFARRGGLSLTAPGIPSLMTRPETPEERQARLAGGREDPGLRRDPGFLADQRNRLLDADAARNQRDQARADQRIADREAAKRQAEFAASPEGKAKAAEQEQWNQYLQGPAEKGVAGPVQTFKEFKEAPARFADQERLKDEQAKLDARLKELAEEKTVRGPGRPKPAARTAPFEPPIDDRTLHPDVLAARRADEDRRKAAQERQRQTIAGANRQLSPDQQAAMARAGLTPAPPTPPKPAAEPKPKPEPAKIAAAAKPRTEAERLADVDETERKRKDVNAKLRDAERPRFETPEEGRQSLAKLNEQRRQAEADVAELKKPKRFDSQEFSTGADFASFAIQKSLSDPDSDAKKTTEELKAANSKLEELKAEIAAVTAAINAKPPAGAVLRGRS